MITIAPACRILVAEPHESIRADLCEVLGQLGHHPEMVESRDQVLGCLAKESYAMVLLSTDMCEDNMADLLREVEQRYPRVAIVIMDSSPSVSSVREALRLGARDYLIKPFGLEELVAAVERASRNVHDAAPNQTK
ncbi:MAG: response regulator [bacterium]